VKITGACSEEGGGREGFDSLKPSRRPRRSGQRKKGRGRRLRIGKSPGAAPSGIGRREKKEGREERVRKELSSS